MKNVQFYLHQTMRDYVYNNEKYLFDFGHGFWIHFNRYLNLGVNSIFLVLVISPTRISPAALSAIMVCASVIRDPILDTSTLPWLTILLRGLPIGAGDFGR